MVCAVLSVDQTGERMTVNISLTADVYHPNSALGRIFYRLVRMIGGGGRTQPPFGRDVPGRDAVVNMFFHV